MDKVRRYFAMAGALLGGVGAFYLIAPLENLLKQEFTVYVSAGVIVFAAAVLAFSSLEHRFQGRSLVEWIGWPSLW